jgi:transposase-like protein
MEAELEEKLGYAKEERSAKNTDNCRNESSKFWLGVMNDLKNRGVQDVMYPAKT